MSGGPATGCEGAEMTIWIPCSGLASIDGLVWLPRLVQKARRFEEGRASGRDLMDGYLYGDNDFIDRDVLRFLQVDDASVSALVKREPSDDAVARILIAQSGHSVEECTAFSRRLRRKFINFSFLEADEGRLTPGFKSSALAFFYNRIMMPPVYAMFRRDEKKRAG